ncbi:MAG: hypothetical protein QG629_202 [Patescibacteria group bacterium]|nr:hypothetical protein [Patescibacteria group bacterium]
MALLLTPFIRPTPVAAVDTAASPRIIRVATFNVLSQFWDRQNSTKKTWNQRKASVFDRISAFDPDIIGLQEVILQNPDKSGVSKQRADVVNYMIKKGYKYYVGSKQNSGPIFFRASKFKVINKGEILLVAAQPRSKSGPAARYLTWVRLSSEHGQILVLNYHLNQFREVNQQIAKLEKIIKNKPQPDEYVFLTGDFNERHGIIANKTELRLIDKATGIDHVLGSKNMRSKGWVKLKPGDPPASDHRLVGVRVELRRQQLH